MVDFDAGLSDNSSDSLADFLVNFFSGDTSIIFHVFDELGNCDIDYPYDLSSTTSSSTQDSSEQNSSKSNSFTSDKGLESMLSLLLTAPLIDPEKNRVLSCCNCQQTDFDFYFLYDIAYNYGDTVFNTTTFDKYSGEFTAYFSETSIELNPVFPRKIGL